MISCNPRSIVHDTRIPYSIFAQLFPKVSISFLHFHDRKSCCVKCNLNRIITSSSSGWRKSNLLPYTIVRISSTFFCPRRHPMCSCRGKRPNLSFTGLLQSRHAWGCRVLRCSDEDLCVEIRNESETQKLVIQPGDPVADLIILNGEIPNIIYGS
jgi:hypothetical protein